MIAFVVVEIGCAVVFFSFAGKARDFLGKVAQVENKDNGTQENCSPTWLRISGFMVIGNFAVYLIEFY